MKVPNLEHLAGLSYLSLSRLQNEGSQHGHCQQLLRDKSIKATE